MALVLTVNFQGTLANGTQGPKTATISPSDDAVLRAAKKSGYREQIPNPTAARDYELKMSEVLAADPGSTQRATLQAEANALQAESRQLVANPMGPEEFTVLAVRQMLESLLVDTEAIQAAATAAEVEQKNAATAALALDIQEG